MEPRLTITIDGATAQVPEGSTILAAARSLGIDVPTLCDDPRLEPLGGCRLCVVEVEGQARLVAACATRAVHGMRVRTTSPHIEAQRRGVLELLRERLGPRPAGAPESELDRVAKRLGVGDAGRGVSRIDADHPYIRVDMGRCISCFRCARICHEVQGQDTWYVHGRGSTLELRPDSDGSLAASSCVSCGACADTCPSGALLDKSVLLRGPAETWTRTTCAYCGVGCELEIGVRSGQLVQARPVLSAPVNKGHLCVKGRYAFDYVHATDRVTTPLLRRGDDWVAVSWPEAVSFVAQTLSELVAAHGPASIGVLGSARATNEENFVAQKFARLALGTNNVDCCARVCHAPSAAAMHRMLGTGAATNCFDDIEIADALLVVGANATESHPVVGARLRQRARSGAALVVIDPRRTELAAEADVHLALRPGTNVPLLNAMACTIVEEGLCDRAFLAARVDGWDELCGFVARFSPETVAPICGVDAAAIRAAARLYATRLPAMCLHGLGVTEHLQGTEGVECLVNLALITGNVGRPGAGVNPLRGQNNVQGAAHMGCEPQHLTGFAPLATGAVRFAERWGRPLPTAPGLDLMRMVEAAGCGELKALWAMGYDVALTNPNASETLTALRRLELVIIQDMFMTETARAVGTVFLPACSSFEKEGTFMNAERRVQRVRPALAPLGESKPDWQALCLVASALGHGESFAYASAEEIWDEVRALWPAGRGMTYQRLERGGLQWPCPDEAHPGTRHLHTESFAGAPRAALRCIDYTPTPEVTDEQFPLLLTTGRVLYEFNAGTMTRRTPNIVLHREDELEVAPEDALRLGLADGQRVLVRSRHGAATLAVRVSPRLKHGEVFTTFATAEAFVNRVTSAHRDRFTRTPEYKVTAVRIETAW